MAHFTRPLRWIACLDLKLYDVYMASSGPLKKLVPSEVKFLEVEGIDASTFGRIVGKADPIYDSETFERHIEADLTILDQIKPDLVIGDFRHSLSVSCRIKKITYINITNAYWSPRLRMNFPVPEAPAIRFFGDGLFSILLKPVLPFLVKLNFFKMAFQLRKSFRRANLKFWDYREVITDGDLVVYGDTPWLVDLKQKSKNEIFVGPISWSMPVDLPTWWMQLEKSRKKILVSLGSSGDPTLLPTLVDALSKLDVDIVVTTSGKEVDLSIRPNIFVTEFLPLNNVLSDFSLVVCNGGSPICYPALGLGIPVLGIIFNNDQVLNMAHIQEKGAGLALRYWNLSEFKILQAIRRLLSEPSFRESAKTAQKEFAKFDTDNELRQIIQTELARLF